MSSRTRYFLIGSALVVVVGLCTGLVAYYNGGLPGLGAAERLPELAYVPADASAVAYADVKDIMNSEFRQRLRTLLPAGTEKDRLLSETGIDIDHDIDSVVAGLGAPSAGAGGAIVLLRGRFNRERIEALAAQHGAVAETYKGTPLMSSPPESAPGSGPAIAFLQTGLLALGSRDRLRQAIDAAASGHAVTADPRLMEYVASAQRSGNAWIVGHFDPISAEQAMPAQIRSQLPPVDWFTVSADVDRAVHGLVRADARDDQAGEQLRSTVSGALSAARLVAGHDARVDAALGSLQVSGAGKTVEVAFNVGPDLLGVVKDAIPALSRPAQAR